MKNKTGWLFLLTLLLTGCMTAQRQLYHPRTLDKIRTISLDHRENISNYDNVPFELERHVRKLLHERYKLKVVSEKADLRIKLIFIAFHRGTLRK